MDTVGIEPTTSCKLENIRSNAKQARYHCAKCPCWVKAQHNILYDSYFRRGFQTWQYLTIDAGFATSVTVHIHLHTAGVLSSTRHSIGCITSQHRKRIRQKDKSLTIKIVRVRKGRHRLKHLTPWASWNKCQSSSSSHIQGVIPMCQATPKR